MTVDAVLAQCRDRIAQPLSVVTDTWKASHPGGRAVAVYPVWAPAEVIHAAGMLPLSLLGGGLGLLLAWGTQKPIATAFAAFFPGFVVKPETFAIAAAVSVLIGLAAGLIPAFYASRLRPVEALRSAD